MTRLKADQRHAVRFSLNGKPVEGEAEPRMLLSDFLRHQLGATGTHVGCEHGVCGACTVVVDGMLTRSCLTLAAQVDGCELRTVEGLAPSADRLGVLQQAFRRNHALQCGFCTAGILMSLDHYLARNPVPMAAWGLIVAVLLALGTIPAFVGLAVVIPLLGHSTWHLYRKVIASDPAARPVPPPPHRPRKPAADFPANLFPWRNRTDA